MTLTGTEAYYQRRATEYDQVYAKPERQADLRVLEKRVGATFEGQNVLEVATGTGYWTQFYADAANSVVATDMNHEVLEVARARRVWPATVSFHAANAFELTTVTPNTDSAPANAAFVGFFWSHLLRNQLSPFLAHLASCLSPSATVLFMDNRYVEGSNHAITKTDDAGNTYQQRRLNDGTEWTVLKNFPTASEITEQLAPHFTHISVSEFDYYWLAQASTPAEDLG